MKSIVPYFWCNKNAEEFVNFYADLFPESRTGEKTYYTAASAEVSGMKERDLLTYQFWLFGQEYVALNGGDFFKFSPAISLTLSCETEEQINTLWEKIAAGGGVVRMPLGEYPFSKRYGWLEDQFGISWQLNLSGEKMKISPSLLFVGDKFAKALEAAEFYKSLFQDKGQILHQTKFSEKGPDPDGTQAYVAAKLANLEFVFMDGPGVHEFDFTGALSFLIDCEDQAEIDYFWSELTKGGQELPCGWVTDKYGVTWQVFSNSLQQYFEPQGERKSEEALKAMYGMKKIIMNDIKAAYENAT